MIEAYIYHHLQRGVHSESKTAKFMILAELDQKIQAFLEIQICQNLAIFRNFDLDLLPNQWADPPKNLDFFFLVYTLFYIFMP